MVGSLEYQKKYASKNIRILIKVVDLYPSFLKLKSDAGKNVLLLY